MSRTTRKPRWYCEHNEVSFINNDYHIELSYYYITKRTRRDKDVVNAEIAAANKKYEEAVAANGGTAVLASTYCSWLGTVHQRYIQRDYVSRFTYEKVFVGKQYFIEEAKAKYKALTRDGSMSESGRKKAFRKDCARTTRRANKRFCKAVLDDAWEHLSAPSYSDTSYKVWSYW